MTRSKPTISSRKCLARALGKLQLWKVGTDLRAWLLRILHNEYVNQIRRAARKGTPVDWNEYESTLTCAPGQIEHLEIRDLVRALKSLPEEQRNAVLMISLTSDYYEAAWRAKSPSAPYDLAFRVAGRPSAR
jgi:RNA polymerase sigma-70 factor, ECF subfamily